LEHDSRLAVPMAYLTAPTLVGRDTELVAVRRRALRALRGHGASLLVEGEAGVGRSRFLDACALEGKLVGGLVLRAQTTAVHAAAYSVMRSLLLQLHAGQSDAERVALPPPPELSTQLLPGLNWAEAHSRATSMRPVPRQEVADLSQALYDYLIELARRRPLMV